MAQGRGGAREKEEQELRVLLTGTSQWLHVVGWLAALPVASCLLAVGSWQLAATKAYYSARNKHKVGAICNINLKG